MGGKRWFAGKPLGCAGDVAKPPDEWPKVSDTKALNYFGGMSGEMETPGVR